MAIPGLHHVTAIAGEPQANLDFYTGILGLRLVKITVNYDDPGTYHLYYGDTVGSPGSALTFFPWPGAPRGRHGHSQAAVTTFSVPKDSLTYWADRLTAHQVAMDGHARRFDEDVLAFRDPDGLRLELAAVSSDLREPWRDGPVQPEHAIRGFHSVTLAEENRERTAAFLTSNLGFRQTVQHGRRTRFEAGAGGAGAIVDLDETPELPPGRVAVGTVHHIAWRAPGAEDQRAWRDALGAAGFRVTPVIDRNYFQSIYFREPGGVLFEIATDAPGFTVDEPASALGSGLRLPPWFEPQRERIEKNLPALRLPVLAKGA